MSSSSGDDLASDSRSPRPGGLRRQTKQRRRNGGTDPRRSALQDRLEEINVMELHVDGRPAGHQTMTLRGLYNYVMKAITNRPPGSAAASAANVLQAAMTASGASPKSPVPRPRPPAAAGRRLRCVSVAPPPPPVPRPPPPPPLFSLGDSAAAAAAAAADAAGGGREDRRTGAAAASPDGSPGDGGGGGGEDEDGEDRTPGAVARRSGPAPSPSAEDGAAPPPSAATAAASPPPSIPPSALAGSMGEPPASGNRVSFLPGGAPIPPPLSPIGRRTATASTVGSAGGPQPHHPEDRHVVTYRERLGGYLHPRDMRRLVTPFSSSNAPELMVRRHVMLLNFDPLRAIVLRDRLLVVVPSGADSILMSLERRLRGGLDEVENEVFGEAEEEAVAAAAPPPTSPAAAAAAAAVPIEAVAVVSPWDETEETAAARSEDAAGAGGGDGDRPEGTSAPMGDDVGGDADGGNGEGPSGSPRPQTSGEAALGDEGGFDDEDEDSTASTESTSDLVMEADEWQDIEGKNWTEMAFELQAVDAVLSSASLMLAHEAYELEREVKETTASLHGGGGGSSAASSPRPSSAAAAPGEHSQERLRVQKDRVGEMEARVQGFVRAMNLVLDEDEDMALMNLSRLLTHPERFIQPVSQEILEEESDEPELILEGYLQQALSTVNALQLLKGQISSTEELVNMMLDTVRNRLLYINTLLSLASLCVATASLIGSIFGMNLLNGLEDEENTFVQVVIGTIIGSFLLLCVLAFAFNRAMSVTKIPYENA